MAAVTNERHAPGDPFAWRARDWNDAAAALEQLAAAGGGGGGVGRAGRTASVFEGGFHALLSGSGSPYSWVERVRVDGAWQPGVRSGTGSAVEVNGLAGLSGNVAWLEPCSPGEWCFQWAKLGCTVTYTYHLQGCNNLPLPGVLITAAKSGQASITATTDASGNATFTTPSAGWALAAAPGRRFDNGFPSSTGSATCGHTIATTITYGAGRISSPAGYGYGCGYAGAAGYGYGVGYIDSPYYFCVPTCVQPIPPTLILTSPLGTTCLPQRSADGFLRPAGNWGTNGFGEEPYYNLTFGRLSGSVAGVALQYFPAFPGFYCGSAATVVASETYELQPTGTGWRLAKRWYECTTSASGGVAPGGIVADHDPLRYPQTSGGGTVPANMGPNYTGNGDNAQGRVQQVTVPYGCSPLALSFTFTEGVSTGTVTIIEAPGQ